GWKVRPANHPFNNPFNVGQQVKIEWNGNWWDGQILEINEDLYHITYTDYSSDWDEWVGVSRLKSL
ncbi:MAG: Tudor-knot domain-containing protein, partial [Candidatus Poseidoniaceae archaeon]|nr:Tudor-knot domain-containing protein [Candidatus Poseidoniaceae archaeon]